jgi:hypothetical protein
MEMEELPHLSKIAQSETSVFMGYYVSEENTCILKRPAATEMA